MSIKTYLINRFSKPVTVAQHFKSIKSNFGNVGKIVYQEPGMRLYQINNSDDLLQIGFVDYGKIVGEIFVVRRLVPASCSYNEYLNKVDSVCEIRKTQFANTPNKVLQTCAIKKLSPEIFANKFNVGSDKLSKAPLISKEKILDDFYFSPDWYISKSKMIDYRNKKK